jgi:ketosteroid isomerase-like protein
MIRIVAALAFWIAACGAALGQAADLPQADREAIRATIEAQLDAFRHDDGAAAFSFASPDIQRQFRSPEVFMHMVRQGYPQVYRALEADFRELVTADGATLQAVLVVGPDGSTAMALYRMQKQSDGSWRIDGCTLLRTAETAT